MKPCTGCGQCCLTYKCKVSELAFGSSDEICPMLHFIKPGYYRCLFVEIENHANIDTLIHKVLGIGNGCTNDYKNGG